MMKKIYFKSIVVFLLLINFTTISAQEITDFFQKTDAFLKEHVVNGKVNYKAITTNPKQLNELTVIAETIDVSVANANQYRAFWINAYNLTVIKAVVENYPIKNPLDVQGFFDKNKHQISGKEVTLNDIENKLLRAQFNNDPRFHFVLVCAGLGCPPIISKAYLPATIEAQLNEQTSIALNNPDFIKVNARKKKVLFSQIFEWYTSDFTANNKSLIAFVNQYRKEEIPTKFKTGYYPYNWSLNESN